MAKSCSLRSSRSIVRRVTSQRTLSSRIWGLDWGCQLPWSFGDVTVTVGSFPDALSFVGDHYETIFGSGKDSGFLSDPFSEAKRPYVGRVAIAEIRQTIRFDEINLACRAKAV